MISENIIKIKGLSKSYGKIRAIKNISISVKEGEIFGYLGPNGAGKTTTIRVLLGLLKADNGEIFISGMNIKTSLQKILKLTGYLPGEFSPYENLTGGQFLEYFSNLNGGADPGYINELAERFDCSLKHKISTLSTGNKQKLGIIQAVMSGPGLIILDEPTRGLDPLIRQEFYNLLRELQSEGRTIFLSSHVLTEVERICDRAGVIRNGEIVTIEDISSLKDRSYKNLEITCREKIDKKLLENIPDITEIQISGNILKCHVTGDMDQVIKAVQGSYIVDIVSSYPSLDEVFLKFYNGEKHVP